MRISSRHRSCLGLEALGAVVLVALLGCKSSDRCTPGESIACAGPAQCTGFQVCASNGDSYEACTCGGSHDADASVPDSQSPADAGSDAADSMTVAAQDSGATPASTACVDLGAYGGAGDGSTDNTVPMKQALAALPPEGGCISLSAGEFLFKSPIAFTFADQMSSVKLIGAGADATVLDWPAVGGGLTFNYKNVGNSVHVRDLTLATGTAGGGTALSLIQLEPANAVEFGYNAVSDLIAVTVRGADGYAQSDYWNVGAFISGVSNVNVLSTEFEGPGVQSGYSTVGTGIWFEGLSATIPAVVLNIESSAFNLLGYGVKYGNFAQGIDIVDTNFTGCSYGILVPSQEEGLAQLAVTSCQLNSSRADIEVDSPVQGVLIQSSWFWIPSVGASPAVGIDLSANLGTTIVGNTLFGQPNSAGAAITNGIVLNGSTVDTKNGSPVGSTVTSNVLDGNETAIWLQSGASNVLVQSNTFSDNGTTVLNQGTGNTVSP